MVQITGKYTHTKSENLDNYFKAVGVPYIPRKMMCSTSPTIEILNNEEGQWTITTATMFRTTSYTFKLGEKYEESMPGNNVIQCVTQLQDDKLITNLVGPDGSETTRTYEFSDEGMTITYKHKASDVEAKRFYKRV